MITGKLLDNILTFLKKVYKKLDLGPQTYISMRNDFKNGHLDEWRNFFMNTPYEDEFEDLITEVEIFKEDNNI